MLHVTVETDCELLYSSYLFAGLSELAGTGRIRLRYRPRLSRPRHPGDLWTPLLEVRDSLAGEARRLAVDFHDLATRFSTAKLERADVYFKRNYLDDEVGRLPRNLRSKVRPAGLSYPVRWPREGGRLPRRIGALSQLFLADPKAGRLRHAHRVVVAAPRAHARLRTVSDYEGDPASEPESVVFFQSRCWDGTEDRVRVTSERADLIRALRKEFGDRFAGGLVPDDVARARYPDCLTRLPTDPASYSSLVKHSLVNVYTRGIRDSPAWKLGEYLAAGNCVVAERPKTRLPRPLEDGKDAMLFDDLEGCVRACGRLLDNPSIAERLRAGARAYYLDEVRPAARCWKMLMAALGMTHPTSTVREIAP